MQERALTGVAGGAGGTIVLSALRYILSAVGLVYETAPVQVVNRLQQTGLISDRPLAKRLLTLVAHLGYGMGAGAALGVLRREREDLATELAVGTALGVLVWGVSWVVVLPTIGADRTPWHYRTPSVLLPILDHAVFGAAWGLVAWILARRKR